MPSKQSRRTKETVPVRAEWKDPNQLPTLYANHFYISHAGGEFYLIFGEAKFPIMITPGHVPEQIDIVPVARLLVNPDVMMRIADAISTTVKNYLQSAESREDT